jgi:hypothetical protein
MSFSHAQKNVKEKFLCLYEKFKNDSLKFRVVNLMKIKQSKIKSRELDEKND